MKIHLKYLSITLIVLGIFQLSNYIILKYFRSVINAGCSNGICKSNVFALLIAIIFLLAMVIWIHLKLVRKSNQNILLILCAIIASAISNILDRIIYGGTIDYIRFGDITISNMSDTIIVLGALLIGILLAKQKQPPKLS